MSVQRWSYKHNEVGHGVYPDDKGELVAWDDYDALASVCRELIEEPECTCYQYQTRGLCRNCKAKAAALRRYRGE